MHPKVSWIAAVLTACSGSLPEWSGGDTDRTTDSGIHADSGESSPAWVDISAGTYHSCAVGSDGTLQCWGDSALVERVGTPGDLTAVASAYGTVCGLKTDQTILCWSTSYPNLEHPPKGIFTQISLGYGHGCALRTDQEIVCWGLGGFGQTVPPAESYTHVTSAYYHSCGLTTGQEILCWGQVSKHLADGVEAEQGKYTTVEAGTELDCALHIDGQPICWGVPDTVNSTPSQPVEAISVGSHSACGILEGGDLSCWGHNNYVYPTDSPDQALSVAAGEHHNCAILSSEELDCWGGTDSYGEIDGHP